MRYLVTGGAGFIGSHLVDELVRLDQKVRVLDNLSTGDKNYLSSVWSQIEFVKGNIGNSEDLRIALDGIDVVFHQAALRSVARSMDDPISTDRVNISGTLQLLMACKEARVKRIVYSSSSSVYGDNKVFPQVETLQPSPRSPYAVSKLAAEHYMGVFAKEYGLQTVSLRYFNVFGPRQSPDSSYATVIPKFMRLAMRGEPLEIHWDGRQSRDFSFVDNIVQANLLAAKVPHVNGEVFNIACGKNNSLLDIIHILEDLCGRRLKRKYLPRRAGDIRKTWGDIRKARRLLGYKPLVNLEEGLKRTWAWHQRVYSLGKMT